MPLEPAQHRQGQEIPARPGDRVRRRGTPRPYTAGRGSPCTPSRTLRRMGRWSAIQMPTPRDDARDTEYPGVSGARGRRGTRYRGKDRHVSGVARPRCGKDPNDERIKRSECDVAVGARHRVDVVPVTGDPHVKPAVQLVRLRKIGPSAPGMRAGFRGMSPSAIIVPPPPGGGGTRGTSRRPRHQGESRRGRALIIAAIVSTPRSVVVNDGGAVA